MAQAFSQPEILAIKLFFLAAALLLAAAVAAARWAMSPADAINQPVVQPIPFSHKHHAGDDGIDCRYCHTSVEKSSFAGLPTTQICLTCHSQLFRDAPMLSPLHESARTQTPIRWNRVHDLPDFVYFDHSIHVSKGVACVECHGRVDQMPLTTRVASLDMQWCLECHRNAQQRIRPKSEVFSMTAARPSPQEAAQLARLYHLQDTRRLTDCSTCHR
ncbi:MAG TPA: cytochrome c3 family protein [Noviherbaspirillum sp.]|nr:cytochrome c3 family protein [Noviherbaspirillum sp.]